MLRNKSLKDISRYGIGHEQFVWDLRSEPGLIDKFEEVWGTRELLVSYGMYNPFSLLPTLELLQIIVYQIL